MKKVLLIASLLVVVANSAFAAPLASAAVTAAGAAIYGGVDAAAALAAPTPLIRFSTGVSGQVNFADNTAYLLATKHVNGSKIFATNNAVTNIYWKQATATILGGTGAALGFTTAASSNFVGNGWTSY